MTKVEWVRFLYPEYCVREDGDPNTVYQVVRPSYGRLVDMHIRLPDGRLLAMEEVDGQRCFSLVPLADALARNVERVEAVRVFGWDDEPPTFSGDPAEMGMLRWQIKAAVETNSTFVVKLTRIAYDLLNTVDGWLRFGEGLDDIAHMLELVEDTVMCPDGGPAVNVYRYGCCS